MNNFYNTDLAFYLKEINKRPLLSVQKQNELAILAQKGNIKARNELVCANLRFVVNVAKAYQNQGLEMLDLISEGNLGLLTAVQKFDAKKGNHFITYAVWWIRQGILKAISEKGRAIRLPQNRTNELLKIKKIKKSLASIKSEEQEIREIAESLNFDSQMVRELLQLSQETTSLETTETECDGEKVSLENILRDDANPTPEDATINTFMKQDVEKVLKTLKPNEVKILKLRYGFSDGKERSLKEVGDICHLTKERIRQIEKHALFRLRNPTKTRLLEAYVA